MTLHGTFHAKQVFDNVKCISFIDEIHSIFIDKVSNIQSLIELLNEHTIDNYELKILRNDQVKILSKTSEIYTTIIKQLEIKETEFYTYKPKQDRNFKVILKDMHLSSNTNEIKEALEDRGYIVNNIWNIKKRTTKKLLPMFIVELQPKHNNKLIYDIKSLTQCRFSFEPPKPKREISQCANCQQYGHTKAYCRRKPKCIKCAGNRNSINCARKSKSTDVKYVLCESNHLANYKGCIVYKNL